MTLQPRKMEEIIIILFQSSHRLFHMFTNLQIVNIHIVATIRSNNQLRMCLDLKLTLQVLIEYKNLQI